MDKKSPARLCTVLCNQKYPFIAWLCGLLLIGQATAQVQVPAGPFTMGTNHPRATDEQPSHQVEMSAFTIDRNEVDNARFAAFVADTGYRTAAEAEDAPETADGISWRHPQGPGSTAIPEHPAVYVNWYDAQAYCTWRGARLPTEAEWEKSARGNDARLWPWGSTFDAKRANHWGLEDGYAGLAPVGSFPEGASFYGALDLAATQVRVHGAPDIVGRHHVGDQPLLIEDDDLRLMPGSPLPTARGFSTRGSARP